MMTIKTQIFADYFSSVFTKEPEGNIPMLHNKLSQQMLDLEVRNEDIKQIKKLTPNKSPGPDGIHPKFIYKKTGESISEPLCLIFNKSLEQMKIPHPWKQAKICAIFKKGNKKVASNYRPVSLTAMICKIMESIIRNYIKFMQDNRLFSNKQYRFISGRSTSLPLLTVLEEWTKALDEGLSVDCIYMDYRKAFDTVPHKRLLGKLKSYGFSDQINFLIGRVQKVTVNNQDSKWKPVDSGIPKVSVLGPILFVIYINDLPEIVESQIYLFADDTKLYRAISDINDQEILQRDLNIMNKWSDIWLLRIHADKCKHMNIRSNEKWRTWR